MGTYSSSGNVQYVTIGQSGTYDIVAYGAQGGSAAGNTGGNGAEIGGVFDLAAGQQLRIVVGGQGLNAVVGDGGGAGISGLAAGQQLESVVGGHYMGYGGGGGGFTEVLANSGAGTSYSALMIAGGGGGAAPGPRGYGYGGTVSSPGTMPGHGGIGGFGQFGGGGGAGGTGNGGYSSDQGDQRQFTGGQTGPSYAGGTGIVQYSNTGDGGFGGGGGGSGGGGGGGGSIGGNGGYFSSTNGYGYGGGGGTSYFSSVGTLEAAQTAGGVRKGDGLATITETTGSGPVCFAAGTRIRVMRGGAACDVAVERLVVGDLAVTASGAERPIRWLGHRATRCAGHREPAQVNPVRIAAHAFGPNRPARDLVVSPGHSLCLDALGEVLVPARALIDGERVVQLDVAEVVYWHVELDGHDVLLAENLPAESYLEMGNRDFFAEADAVALHARPDALIATHERFCRQFVSDGPRLAAIKARLTRAGRSAAGLQRGAA